ncbi:MAG: hypothetical protein ACRELE_07985, partial [Gemmatimonadales bacterium]
GYGDVDGIIEAHRKGGYSSSVPDPLKDLDARVRFALEMAAHEDTERTALAGELKLLEREWRAADELAKIADSLAVSAEGHGA